ncbi:MAG: GxxExxY protein [Candidatus Cloacimonetes bacterium]|nr:GxxExxY protein [Candidatus Cloacimonadota bacterium]
MTELLYGEVTEKIRQAAFEVHKYSGNGFLEKVYENSLVYKLGKIGFSVKQQEPIKVYFENTVAVGDYFADLIVDHKIIIELKTVHSLDKVHFAQLKNYLKATKFRLGLLINFGAKELQFKRVIL